MPAFIYWIICVIIGLIPALLTWRKDRQMRNRLKWLPAVFRGLAFFLVAVLLLAPAFSFTSNKTQKPLIIWLQDNSSSLGDALGNRKNDYLEKKREVTEELNGDYELAELQFGADIRKDGNTDFSEKVTNIEQAITGAIQRYKGSNLGGVIIASDGIYNEGMDPLYVAQSLPVPVYTIALGDSTRPKDVSVQRVFANKVVMAGSTFEVAADVRFSRMPASAHAIQLLQNGAVIQHKAVSIADDDQTISVSFEVKPASPGMYRYSIAVPQADGEKTVLNNKLDFYVQVISNEVKVLVLNGGTHPDIGFIRNALKTAAGYQVAIAAPDALPADFSEYNCIIAHQPNLPAAQWKKIEDSGIPVWHILGNNTTNAQAHLLQPKIRITGSRPGVFHTPVNQKSFTSFLLPLNASGIMTRLPPLESNIQKARSSGSNNTVIRSKESGEDIWTVFPGDKPVAVTIGEGIWRWGIYEFKDNKSQLVTQELVRQTMHLLHVPRQDKPFQVFLSKRLLTDNENIAFTAELRNKSGQLTNDAEALLQVADSSGQVKKFVFEKMGDAYQLLLPKMGAGIYTYTGTVNYQGKAYADQGTFAVEDLPLEQINTQADYGMLYMLSSETEGAFFTYDNFTNLVKSVKANKNINSIIISEDKREPFINYRWLFFIILALLSAEWLYRKYFGMQ